MVRSGKNLALKVKLAQSAWILATCRTNNYSQSQWWEFVYWNHSQRPKGKHVQSSTELFIQAPSNSRYCDNIMSSYPEQMQYYSARWLPRLAVFLLFPVPSEQKTWPPVSIYTVLPPWSISPLNNRDSNIIGPYQGAEINSDWTKALLRKSKCLCDSGRIGIISQPNCHLLTSYYAKRSQKTAWHNRMADEVGRRLREA